jgi:hypothetical protein
MSVFIHSVAYAFQHRPERSGSDIVKVLNNICRAGNATCRKRLMHDDMNEPLMSNPVNGHPSNLALILCQWMLLQLPPF